MDTPERLRATLVWLDSKLECFDPMPGGNLDFASLKAFAELSIAVQYLREYGSRLPADSAVVGAFLQRATTLISTHCERPEFVEAALHQPLLAYAYVLPYLSLRGSGFRSEKSETLLEWMFARRLAVSAEMVPYRQLDRLHFFWKAGLLDKAPAWKRLYAETVLAKRDGALYYDDEDAYSATHTIFYLTDFGLREAELSLAEKNRVSHVLEGLLVHAWRLKNWDLMGEILTCLNCLRLAATPLKLQADEYFAGLVRENGTVLPYARGARGRKPKSKRRSGEAAGWDDESFHCYHTTLVHLLYVLSSVAA